MKARAFPLLGVLATALVLVACGATPSPAPVRTGGTTSTTRSNFTVTVSPARLTAGQVVGVQVTASGPLLYMEKCSNPFSISVTDRSGDQIWVEPYTNQCPPAAGTLPEHLVQLPAGSTA